MSETTSKKRKLSLPLIVAGGVSSLVLALGMSPTFSAFTAQITNSVNNATAGTLILTETGGSVICNSNDTTPSTNTLGTTNASTCAIDKFGPNTPLAPGQSLTTTVTMKNSGTVTPTSFSLTPQACSQVLGTPNGGASTACNKFNIKVYLGSTAGTTPLNGVGQQTASTFATALNLTPLAPGATQDYTFVIQLDSSADNSYQGITINQPLVWKFQV
jgi:hypothetical protein